MQSTARTAIDRRIPVEVAWYEGQRVWIAASIHSQLGKWLLTRAHWDEASNAWWMGRASLTTEVVRQIRDHVQRRNYVERLRASGVRVSIQGDRKDVAPLVREHHGVWESGSILVFPDRGRAEQACRDALSRGIDAEIIDSHPVTDQQADAPDAANDAGSDEQPTVDAHGARGRGDRGAIIRRVLHLVANAHPIPAPPPCIEPPILELRDAANGAPLVVVRRWPNDPQLALVTCLGAHYLAWGAEALASEVPTGMVLDCAISVEERMEYPIPDKDVR